MVDATAEDESSMARFFPTVSNLFLPTGGRHMTVPNIGTKEKDPSIPHMHMSWHRIFHRTLQLQRKMRC